ncbi:RHS repeat protein [Yersinia rochesterensis]|uniref:RHS repeat domain-containing protein n=1 Tax=Yersinia TaxID=629 RepID=UPI00223FD4CC|nr:MULTISPECIES: RHS repeat domain-containing protein [Yersinia]MDA5545064.1 RHS repeat protein [Yersinia rochesterensis]UZM77113.1 RHS repeat protein [Yersinia sp. SCPM-O-B-9106 (C-191)]
MSTILASPLYQYTPTIAISDNRGLAIRVLAYNRTHASDAPDELISRNHYNVLGQLIASRDARLEIDNFRYQYNLAGAALCTEGVDNGQTAQLTDIEGRPVVNVDAKGTRSWMNYEPELGRPLEHHQQAKEGLKTITDRFFYAENSPEYQSANLNGQCLRHYDTAGLQEILSLSITGVPLQQQRQLLTDTLGPVDWFGDEKSWADRLSRESFVTHCTTDALGQPITQTDAKGHHQRMAYNRAGQLIGSWLTVNGGSEQVIVQSLTYSAAGQKLREESGNGVVTEYRYEAETQRLIGIKTARPALKDRPTLLQDLRYDYDPVGNILAIHNDAEATRFYRNQKIVPETTYRYDALYQLIEATGRESDSNGAQSAKLPALSSLTDGNQYVNYTRRYSYDRAGNLLKIQHIGASQYSTNITVSDASNHGIQQQDGLTAADIRSQFDAAGNQQQLQPGQPLQWDARHQLQQVTTVKRSAENPFNDDDENYLYASDGMRVVKQSIQHANNARQTTKVTYLPGLELRSQHNGDKLIEDFQVITVGAAGRAQVRVLHWEHGKPDEIANNQLRYSFDNQIGSSLLELDAHGDIISQEEYYPFGGTAVFASRNTVEAKYKTVRYSGKERDATGLYYYGLRYYLPWLGRWLSSDPAGTVDGLNLYRMVRNNPVRYVDLNGLAPKQLDNNAPPSGREGYLYIPFISRDMVAMAVGINIRRYMKGKTLYPVITAGESNLSDIKKLSEELYSEHAKNREDAVDLYNKANEFDVEGATPEIKQKLETLYNKSTAAMTLNSRTGPVLKNTVYISNIESGGPHTLSTLSPGKHKLYVLGHGSPAGDDISADINGESGSLTSKQIVDLLASEGLPKKFDDIRFNACFGADTVEPESFDNEVLDKSAGFKKRNWLQQLGFKKSFAQKVSEELFNRGFAGIVKAYHGLGDIYSLEGEHTRRIKMNNKPDQVTRGKMVRRTFVSV